MCKFTAPCENTRGLALMLAVMILGDWSSHGYLKILL